MFFGSSSWPCCRAPISSGGALRWAPLQSLFRRRASVQHCNKLASAAPWRAASLFAGICSLGPRSWTPASLCGGQWTAQPAAAPSARTAPLTVGECGPARWQKEHARRGGVVFQPASCPRVLSLGSALRSCSTYKTSMGPRERMAPIRRGKELPQLGGSPVRRAGSRLTAGVACELVPEKAFPTDARRVQSF